MDGIVKNSIRSSVLPGSDRRVVPAGASHTISYGDRIFVRMVSLRGWRPVAEFELRGAADMSEVYGELRHRTRGQKGLMRLYIRNATRGWSFEQPFKLYGDSRTPATSVTHRPVQPLRSACTSATLFDVRTPRTIPDSIKTYLL